MAPPDLPPRILVIEDDSSVREAIFAALQLNGFLVRAAEGGGQLAALLDEFRPDLVILDVLLPDGPNGFELAETVRSLAGVPVVFLTAADELEQRLRGFEVGADDYIVKPFSLAELVARLRVVLRRSQRLVSSTWELRDVVIDETNRAVVRAGQKVALSKTEFELLCVLARAPGQVYSKAQLLSHVWGFDAYDPNLVEVYISSLRRKLEAHGPRLIFTERGEGYVVRAVSAGFEPLEAVKRRLGRPLVSPGVGTRSKTVIFIAGIIAVALIGFVDAVTPPDVSLAAFYLLPTVAITVVVSDWAGMIIAGESAIAWVLADALLPDRPPLVTSVGNGVLRFVVLSIVVLLLATLRGALTSASASDRRAREFLAVAAHQLRTPVSGLRSSAEALIIAGVAPEQERLLTNLAAETDRIGRLVTSLLQITRLDQGQATIARATDLRDLCTTEVELAQERTPSIDIQLDLSGAPKGTVMVSPDATREALANLLDNARRHATQRVDVVLTLDSHDLQISVADDGAGLPPGSEDHAFDRFVTLDGKGGTGLGLSIARRLIEVQGGRVVYADRRFTILLPVR